MDKPGSWFLLGKCLKSTCGHFPSKNQVPGLYINGALVENGLKMITKNVHVRSVSERALLNPGYITKFTTKNGVKNLPPGL